MKKFLLIVNTTVLLFIFSLSILPSPITAQTQPQISSSSPITFLQELLKILFSFSSTGPISSPPPVISGYPTIPISPFVTTAPDPNTSSIIALVDNISRYCGGSVNFSNVSCLDQFSMNANTKTYFLHSADRFYYLQCVDFVKGVVAMTSGVLIGWFGNAINGATNPPPGFQFIRKDLGTIQAGDLPIWDNDTYGHIAYVIQLSGGDTFQVVEANYEGRGGVRIAQKTLSYPNLLGWVRKL